MPFDFEESYKTKPIRLTDLLQVGREYFFTVLRGWWIIALIGIGFAAYKFYTTWKTPPTYTAKLTFMVNEDSGGGGAAISGLLSQFGFGKSGSEANLDRITELLESREIVSRAMFKKKEIRGKTDYLANHYIDVFEMRKAWRKTSNTQLHDFAFKHDSIAAFTRLENSVMKTIKQRIAKAHLSHDKTDGGLIVIRVLTLSEGLSYELANTIFEELSNYYVEKTIEKQKATYDIFEARTDSIAKVLNSAELSLANIQDGNRNIYQQKSFLKEERLIRDVTMANLLYQESARNLETARLSLLTSRPYVQPVDLPMYPLTMDKEKAIQSGIRGGIIGGMLGVVLVIALKFMRDLLRKEQEEIAQEAA